MRASVGDPAYASGVAPEGIDGMVDFYEAFPYDFDLTVVHDRELYLVADQYCLEPGCTCDNVVVQFIPLLGTRGQARRPCGHAKASMRRLRAPIVEGPPVVHQLWRALLDEHGSATLRDRFERMRQVAAGRRRLAAPPPEPKPGRNAPWPCGSGPKYKRCCGR